MYDVDGVAKADGLTLDEQHELEQMLYQWGRSRRDLQKKRY